MDMAGTHMGRQNHPPAMGTNIPQCLQNQSSLPAAHFVGPLLHLFPFRRKPGWVRQKEVASSNVMPAIHRPGFIAVQSCAITVNVIR